MISCCIVGASGYSGAELARLLSAHPSFDVQALYVSANSQDAGKSLDQCHPYLHALADWQQLPLQPLQDKQLSSLAADYDAIFLATPHQASHDWMPVLTGAKAKVFDLSGAFRLSDAQIFADAYGFAHEHGQLLSERVYGLVDWYAAAIAQAKLVAVPGCYPTTALTALKPLASAGLLVEDYMPIINAVSGVSGAGRKAALNTSYCEVSLQAYGVLGHRHQPEITEYLGREVIFTPHLGNFKRGILATITTKLVDGADAATIDAAYQQAYGQQSLVRLQPQWPKIDDIAGTPFCDLHWKYDAKSKHLVIGSALDNLLKGAAAQALQCANLAFALPQNQGLLGAAHG